jgi:hypothetical protein
VGAEGTVQLSVAADDLDAVEARLRTAGVPITRPDHRPATAIPRVGGARWLSGRDRTAMARL